MKKRLSKILWYGEELPNPATSSDDLEGLHEGELFLHLKDDGVTLWSLSADGRVVEISGGGDGDLSQYLLKSIWDRVWEIKTDSQGNEYIFGKLPVVTQYGITMYADGGELNLPSIYAGLPIDGRTLIRDDNGVLMINPDIDLGGGLTEVYWNDIKAKPTFATVATSGKYADLSGLPNLSVYATTEYLTSELKKYVTIDGNEAINGLKNFTKGLQIDGLGITKSQDDVIYLDANLVVRGGITMFGTNSVDAPTIMDAIATDGVNLKVVDGVLTFVGSSGGGLTKVHWNDVEGRPTLLSSFINDKGYIDQDGVFNTDPLKSGLGGVGVVAGGCMTIPTGEKFSDYISKKKSFIGSILNTDNVWYNTISLRHCNGADDGVGYGMVIYSVMNIAYQQELYYNTQVNGSWQDARVILDSHNWSRYIKAGDGGNYLPLSGGEINGSLQISNGSLALLGAKNSGAATISFESNGNSYSSITVSRYGIDYNGVLSILPKGGMVGVGLTNPEYKFHVQGDIYSSGMAIANSGIEARGTSSYGTLPYIRLHIPGLTYAQFLINDNGVVELRYGDNTQTGRFMNFSSGDILSSGGITMYSDIRKKTKLQDVELSLKQIAEAPLIEHYYNSDTMRTTHVGSIAQYWASMNDWFCKLDSEGFYTMEIQNAALASAISIARELVKYESKTDRKIRLLKKRVKELEDKIEKLERKGA